MNKNNTPGWILFSLGVAYPAGVIIYEAFTQLCAEFFFDPMPSVWHGIMVFLVPLSNFLLWRQLRNDSLQRYSALSFLSALSIGVAALYTVIFLPLTPVAFVAIMYFGMGLLPLAPLVSLVVSIVLYRRYRAAVVGQAHSPVAVWKGMSAALLILVLLDIPSVATLQGIQWAASQSADRSLRGVRMLRFIGNEQLLLRHCYDRSGQASGPLGVAMMFLGSGAGYVPTDTVREIYYRVTGEPFNMQPPPFSGGRWQRMNDFQFDRDQGGTEVGGRVRGLQLTSSRMDASLHSDEGIAYLEWVLEFRNDSARQREVRLQIALPPQGVVSRATLWINGEEREAAFAGRAQAIQAYQSVVRRQLDPLLVTTGGTDRLQAQAFPVAPQGGTIKFRLGISAPLQALGQKQDQVQLILPAIVDRNFVIGSKLSHTIWVEGQQALKTNLPGAELETVDASMDASIYRVTASVDDATLSQPRKVVSAPRSTYTGERWAQLDGQPSVVQRIIEQPDQAADALMIVLDGSASTADFVSEITAALEHIPAGARVGLAIAGESEAHIPISSWTPSLQQRFTDTIESTDYVGGQDNAAALAKAFRDLEKYDDGELLWIHLPQPVEFSHGAGVFEQTMTRLISLPRTALYSLRAGPNALLATGRWQLWSRTIPNLSSVTDDLANYFRTTLMSGPQYGYFRYAKAETSELPEGSGHIARLWARDRIRDLLKENSKRSREKAVELAAAYQLVTLVSGAVVLETASQYDENDLQPVDPNSVPTIPEPEQWVLALIIIAMMLWMTREKILNRTAVSLHSRRT